jgi:membrane protease YdiL (CAAX protease family)
MVTARETAQRATRRLPRLAGERFDPKALVAFFALAYALSWAWVIPLAVTHQVVDRGDGWPTHYPSLLGPLLAAFAVTAWTMGPPGVRDLLARMGRWRVRLRWWLVAVSPAAFGAIALLALASAGKELPAVGDFGRFSGTPAIGLAGVFLLITLVGSLGEETGWRGYALPQLQRRFSAFAATLVLAPLWALWHLPQFFVIATYRDFGPVEYVGMLLGLGCGAIVLTWLYNRSGGSVLLVVVWHGVYNFVGATQAAVGMVAAVVSTLVMLQALVLVALELRARRRGQPSVLGPASVAAQP